MNNYVIDVENLSVGYQMYSRPLDQLKELILGGVHHETFWALRDVSLKISEGEKLGIVGPNGAGKSTLLKVIAGTMQATSGRVATHGRISSLLSMVPAWNVEDSGIENIRFNLILNGVPEKRIPAMIEDIADFTELGPFLYHPVKTYSTGMGARLSFGIATATEPDILIIDEVLGTGDGYFAWKATRRMEAFCAKGRAMILVSHSMAAIQSMCDRAIWMQNGSIRQDGTTGEVLADYELDFRRADDETMRRTHASRGITDDPTVTELTDEGHIRIRIVPRTRAPFFSTHYVCDIGLRFDGGERQEASFELAENPGKLPLVLDILNSEWGRLHEKDGRQCRILSRLAGRNFGGQILVRLPEKPAAGFEIDLTVNSGDVREELQAEILDMATGQWKALEPVSKAKSATWRKLAFKGTMSVIDEEAVADITDHVMTASKADADILSVRVIADGAEVASVVERQPFEVQVHVRFNRSPELVDVGMKLTRMDGTYVFWQSSGQVDGNLVRPSGEKIFSFHFDPNILGAAEYFVNSHVTNGWSYPNNYPYSEVFARKINATSFRIVPEFNGLDFGALNQRLRVDIKTVEIDDVVS
jgi:lipopolysaccharide transport system ATP-binding protein